MLNLLKKTDIAVDLGTSKIAVFVRGEGLVFEEPACIAFRGTLESPRDVVATGLDAARMFGKTPQGMFVVNPIQDGVISDCRAAGLLLHALMTKHHVGTGLTRRRFLVGTLYGASSMERRAFEQVALHAGAKNVALVHEPLAAAVGAGLRIEEPRANMVIDVGGGATEAIVISLKSVVSGGSIRVGGNAMNDAIILALRRNFGLEIGVQEARRLKEMVAGTMLVDAEIVVRGVDARMRRPRSSVVTAHDVRAALSSSFAAITNMVSNVIDRLPAELAADLMDRGITLTGGGAATLALQKRIEEATHVTVYPLDAPHQAVINGCGLMLDYIDHIT